MKKLNLFVILLTITTLVACYSQKKNEPEQKKQADAVQTETKKVETKTDKMTQIKIETSMGNITIALYNETPQHRDNFIKLVKESYYDGVLFHRIIKGFMIQTGDPDSKTAKPGQRLGMGGPDYRIPAEFVPTLYHKRGAVAASQFYIVDGTIYDNAKLDMYEQRMGKKFNAEQRHIYSTIGGAPFLDGDYTVFGEVVSGMEVVDKIASQPKDGADRPNTDIKIIRATVVE